MLLGLEEIMANIIPGTIIKAKQKVFCANIDSTDVIYVPAGTVGEGLGGNKTIFVDFCRSNINGTVRETHIITYVSVDDIEFVPIAKMN
jgi:hypothetical protein